MLVLCGVAKERYASSNREAASRAEGKKKSETGIFPKRFKHGANVSMPENFKRHAKFTIRAHECLPFSLAKIKRGQAIRSTSLAAARLATAGQTLCNPPPNSLHLHYGGSNHFG
ncbi:hypothetical protein PMIN04_012772 [Paraphaeosphaeria minitans]